MALPSIDPASRLFALLARAERRIRNALLGALMATRNEADLDELVKLIEAGRFDEAIEAAARAGAIRLAEQATAVYVVSGQETAKFLEDAIEIAVSFDQTNWRAVSYMQQERLRLIREFTTEQLRATREALTDGITRGINPRAMALAFRDSIGLTLRQQQAVQNYRRLLETLDGEALQRALRDRRFDRTVRRAISTGKPLTTEQVNRMVERYSERYVRYRSEVIGRTEALRAVHSGNDEMYRQAVEAGQIDPEQVVRTWVATLDARTRHSHSRLNGQERGFDESWQGDEGPLRFPGDPDAPAAETVQCRCSITTRLREPIA